MRKPFLFILFSLILTVNLFAQEQIGGVSTGEAKTYTSRRTTGITDEKAVKVFEDVTSTTDLKSFKCTSGGKDKNFILETAGGTVAVFDFDNDGKP
ncbi:MAG: hypothetical protein ABIP06_09860, partial [Pyrinomonadaceae bacterium]